MSQSGFPVHEGSSAKAVVAGTSPRDGGVVVVVARERARGRRSIVRAAMGATVRASVHDTARGVRERRRERGWERGATGRRHRGRASELDEARFATCERDRVVARATDRGDDAVARGVRERSVLVAVVAAHRARAECGVQQRRARGEGVDGVRNFDGTLRRRHVVGAEAVQVCHA